MDLPRDERADASSRAADDTDDKFERLIRAMQSRQDTITPEVLKAILAENAGAVHKALKPENATYPAVSATSYPEGDTARPRESVLSHAFFYNNFPVHKFPETHHYRELELAELVQPGTFRVLRKDGTDMTVEVAAERDAKDAITKILVTFPISREDKYLIPPMTVVLYQLVHPDNPRKRFVEAMSEHLNMTLQ